MQTVVTETVPDAEMDESLGVVRGNTLAAPSDATSPSRFGTSPAAS